MKFCNLVIGTVTIKNNKHQKAYTVLKDLTFTWAIGDHLYQCKLDLLIIALSDWEAMIIA